MARSVGFAEACALVGSSGRKVDYYCRLGLVGEALQAPGSGIYRRFDAADLEVLAAVVDAMELGCGSKFAQRVGDAVRVQRVAPEGEWLVVTDDGVGRYDCVLFDDETLMDRALVIRLRSFVVAQSTAV